MKNVIKILAGAALALSLGVARAQVVQDQPIVPLGYCQLSAISVSTGLASCAGGIPTGATLACFSIETTSIRYRDDGTAPTAAIGMPIAISQPPYCYRGTLSKLLMIPTASTSTVDVLFYRNLP